MSHKTAVFDANVVLQSALDESGPANAVMRLMDSGVVEVYHSPHTREEVKLVLYRPEIRQKYSRLTDQRIENILRRMDEKARMVPAVYRSLPYPRDPKDQPILNLAIQEKADYIVSRDKDLLDFDNSRDFRLLYPFLRIVSPELFLAEIAASQIQSPDTEDGTS